MQRIHIESGRSAKSSTNNYYQIVSNLGSGGNSNVYLALCTSGNNQGILFSIKFFCNISKPERKNKFLQETEFLETINHPAIVRVIDKGVYTYSGLEFPFVVSEYYPNTLVDVMKNGADILEKCIYLTNLMSAINYLTLLDKKIVHRDIKPQNIFIKGRSAIVGDFGLMKVLDNENGQCDEDDCSEIEVSLGAGMAFYYRTPDLVDYLNARKGISQASDIFQLGLVAAQLFTGKNPCKPKENIKDDFEMDSVGKVNCNKFGALIAKTIREMLIVDVEKRNSSKIMLDKWNGILTSVSEHVYDLNGTI